MSRDRKIALLAAIGASMAVVVFGANLLVPDAPPPGINALLWQPPTAVWTLGPSPTGATATLTPTPTPNATGWLPIPAITAATVSAASGPYAGVIGTVQAQLRSPTQQWWLDAAWRSPQFSDLSMGRSYEWRARATTVWSYVNAMKDNHIKVQGYFAGEAQGNYSDVALVATFAGGTPVPVPTLFIDLATPGLAIPGSASTPSGGVIPVNPIALRVLQNDDGEVLLLGVGFGRNGYDGIVKVMQEDRSMGTYYVPR